MSVCNESTKHKENTNSATSLAVDVERTLLWWMYM
jgi:hypothetical protein